MSTQTAETAETAAAPVPFAVHAEGVCRRYGRRWVLVDVDVRVPQGTAMMVAGRNGSGKTTLFRVLSTAIRPDRGRVTVEGFDNVYQKQMVRERIALLSHAPYTYEALSALQNLQIAARFLGRDSRRDALVPVLEQLGLGDRADDTISTFSAGMRKRLALARVLLQVGNASRDAKSNDATVVFLDEPYGTLDPPGFRFVDHLFTTLREKGVTVLLATHMLDRGAAVCDTGLVLNQGRVLWTGAAKDLPTHSGLQEGTVE